MKYDSIKISVAKNQLTERTEPEIKIISSEALLAGAREVIINHASEQYLLRLTNQGKLILNQMRGGSKMIVTTKGIHNGR